MCHIERFKVKNHNLQSSHRLKRILIESQALAIIEHAAKDDDDVDDDVDDRGPFVLSVHCVRRFGNMYRMELVCELFSIRGFGHFFVVSVIVIVVVHSYEQKTIHNHNRMTCVLFFFLRQIWCAPPKLVLCMCTSENLLASNYIEFKRILFLHFSWHKMMMMIFFFGMFR